MFAWKGPKINEKEAGDGPFKKFKCTSDALLPALETAAILIRALTMTRR